jgi:hypothetical protein
MLSVTRDLVKVVRLASLAMPRANMLAVDTEGLRDKSAAASINVSLPFHWLFTFLAKRNPAIISDVGTSDIREPSDLPMSEDCVSSTGSA